MNTSLLSGRWSASWSTEDRGKSGRVVRILGALIGGLAACALILPAPASAATTCSTQGLTLHFVGKARLDVVGLTVQGFSCAKAGAVTRQIVRDLSTGGSISLSGVAGMEISSDVPCARCVTETQVSLSYPNGTIDVSLKGMTKAPPSGSIPFALPSLPLPRIPGFVFPSIPSLSFPATSSGGRTVG